MQISQNSCFLNKFEAALIKRDLGKFSKNSAENGCYRVLFR